MCILLIIHDYNHANKCFQTLYLLHKVIEAKKAADANLIMRREGTSAMRSQANTAKLLDNNPALMQLRELGVLEKVAEYSKLSVVIGEKGLADRIVSLL